jgi:hypothetical protein
MRVVGQIASVFAIAIGIGLFVAGRSVAPVLRVDSVTLQWPTGDAEFYHALAATLKGFGSGLLALGLSGLIVPWVNVLLHRRHSTATVPSTPPRSG